MDLHRSRHRVPANAVVRPECRHAPLFVSLFLGKAQIAPLVVDASAKCVPVRPWDLDVLPIPVRRVLEVQNLSAPESGGPHFPQDDRSARALDELYHRLGGPKTVAMEAGSEAGDPEARDWDDSDEEDPHLGQLVPLEYAVERARYYRTAPPYGVTDDELVSHLLDEVGELDEKELRKSLFEDGLVDSPDIPLEVAAKKALEVRGRIPWLDGDALLEAVLRDFPGVGKDDLRDVLVERGLIREPRIHGPYTVAELVRLAAAQGRPWDLVERRLRSLASQEDQRALRALFNRTAGLRAIFGGRHGAYWCGRCESIHYLWSTIGRRHQSFAATRHSLEPV